ncbi:MAG: aminoacyl-tRNA hydrolase [Acidithiobacillales bacterium]
MVGLGNPGDRYTGTRHNVGFDVAEAFAKRAGDGSVRLDRLDCRALTGRLNVGGTPVLVARPQTYMNLSGESVKGLLAKHAVPLERLVVVSDDTALPVGSIRIRRSGSSGGQKGLQSIIETLGTGEFARVRVGVRGEHFRPGDDQADYVLSRFSKAERPVADEAIGRAAEALETIVREGLEAAMNRFNRSPEEEPES